MMRSLRNVLAIKSYQNQAGVLVNNYILAYPYIPDTYVLGGMLTYKLVYDLTQRISTFFFQSYNGLTKIQRIGWNNRGVSTLNAVFIWTISLYFVSGMIFSLITILPGWLDSEIHHSTFAVGLMD